MGKYSSSARRAEGPPRNRGVHPVMRGIGCLLMVIVPILSYGVAVLLVNYVAARWPMPQEWLGIPKIHPVLLSLRGLDPLWGFLQRQPNLVANLLFAFFIMILVGGVLSVVYGYIFSMFGPSRYGPQDVPPPRVKTKKYSR